MHEVPGAVDLQLSESQDRVVVLLGGPAEQRPHPGHQLLFCEGLREVVVRAGVEGGHLVLDGIAAGQHHNWY